MNKKPKPKQMSPKRVKARRTKKKRGIKNNNTNKKNNKPIPKTHAVTFMTPQLEVVSRPILKVQEPKPMYEKVTYGNRDTLYQESTIIEVEPGVLQQPIKYSMDNVHDILTYVDWKVKLYWFHARTPQILQDYWNNRPLPISFPTEGSTEDPRIITIQRFKNVKASRIQALVRGVKLRRTIQARLDLSNLHKRYKKAQFTHPKVRTLCFISLHPCKNWKYRRLNKTNLSAVLSTSSVDTSAGFMKCPICASLVLQNLFRKRKSTLICQGIPRSNFTWKDPLLNKYKTPEIPILRPWRNEKLALRARLTEYSSMKWEEKLQKFRRDKSNHSYAIEEMYREKLLLRQKESIRLIAIWREQVLLNGFLELEQQRKLEGRDTNINGPHAALRNSVVKKRGRRKQSQNNNKTKGKNKNGFSERDRQEERIEMIRKIRDDALKEEEESQLALEKRAAFETKKLEKKLNNTKEILKELTSVGREEKQEEETILNTAEARERVEEKVEAEAEAEAEEREAVQKVEVQLTEVEKEDKKVRMENENDYDNDKEMTEIEKIQSQTTDEITHFLYEMIANIEAAKDTTQNGTISSSTKIKDKKSKKSKLKKKIRTLEEEKLREQRIRKNENAKIKSYVRRLHLATYIGEEGIQQGAASIIQSLIRMSFARVHASTKRRKRASRLKSMQAKRWLLKDNQWIKGWAYLLSEFHRERKEAAASIQGMFRASVAKNLVKRARRWRAAHDLQPWWRGVWVRYEIYPNKIKEKRVEQLHRRVLARMKHGGLIYCLHTWHANVVDLVLNRDRLFLLRQIADRKWIRCCAIRIQSCWRSFYYTMLGIRNHNSAHTTTLSKAHLRIKVLRKKLHPRLEELVTLLEQDGDTDQFAIDILGAVEKWENPNQKLMDSAKIELGNILPLEPLPLHQMQSWIEHTLNRVLLWRPIPLNCVTNPCRCHSSAYEEIHRAGFCRGDVQLPFVLYFPLLNVIQHYFVAVEKMRERQRDVVQALQEKRMIETLGRLVLADTADRGSKYGHQHPRWSQMGIATRSRMNNGALNKDEHAQDYIRWFIDSVDTCAKCKALLSWDTNKGKCCVCGVKRLELPTNSFIVKSKNVLILPPLGGRKGETSRQSIYGVGDIKESIDDLIFHCALCVYAPAGSWRRLAPKWKTWEESRMNLAVPTIEILHSYGIETIGSLWLCKISGQLTNMNEIDTRMIDKLYRLMQFLGDFIMGELLAPETEDVKRMVDGRNNEMITMMMLDERSFRPKEWSRKLRAVTR